jgi:hypothetical protein
MVYNVPVSSRTEFLDDYYQSGDESASENRFKEIESFVQKRSEDLVIVDFVRILDQIKITLEKSGETFVHLLFSSKQDNPVPRYF